MHPLLSLSLEHVDGARIARLDRGGDGQDVPIEGDAGTELGAGLRFERSQLLLEGPRAILPLVDVDGSSCEPDTAFAGRPDGEGVPVDAD